MHNPGHPVRGGPGGEIPPHQGLPQRCPGRPGERTTDLSRGSPPSRLGRDCWTSTASASTLYGRSSPPKPLRITVTQAQLHTQTILGTGSRYVYTPTRQMGEVWPTHLACTSTTLYISQPHSRKPHLQIPNLPMICPHDSTTASL
jgi:hypothetical protein